MIAFGALVVALAMMFGEQQRSRANERILRASGAVEAENDVYKTMSWAYPATFVSMSLEGMYAGRGAAPLLVAGAVVFIAAKFLKYWAIASLGTRWTFRVLTITGTPLVSHGPYAVVRHPNYIAVVGEMLGFALLVQAPVTGALSVVGFTMLLRRRIVVEERALHASR
jgi:methyltransferase